MHALTLRISHCFCVFLFSMSSIRSPCFSLRVHFHHCRDSISWISLFPCFYYLIRPLRCVGQRVVVGVDSQDAPTRIVGSCHDVMVWWSGPEQKERYGCDYVYSGQSPKRVGVVLQNRIQKKKKLKQGYKKEKIRIHPIHPRDEYLTPNPVRSHTRSRRPAPSARRVRG